MRTIIAGSRNAGDLTAEDIDAAVIASGFAITEVVSGGARGVDRLGEQWANAAGLPITFFLVPRDEWQKYGAGAGPRRNRRMAEYADALIAVWDGKSPGTRSMIDAATKLGRKVFVVRLSACE